MKIRVILTILIYLFSITIVLAQYEVHGAIGVFYNTLQATNPKLGEPISNEQTTSDGVGRFQEFKGYDIYWHPNTGAHFISGPIKDRFYAAGGFEAFGYPVTNVTNYNVGNRKGLYVDFHRLKNTSNPEKASIYWSQITGAFEVYGAIYARYKLINGPKSCLGFPSSFEMQDGQGRIQKFENGNYIKWNPRYGAKENCIVSNF